jgi:hypothetical protein
MAFVVSTFILSGGCMETPARGFESFYEALVDARPEDAVSRLSAGARDELTRAAAPHGLSLSDALAATFPKTTIRAIGVVEEGEGRALLEITDALGKKEQVAMVREDGRWKVDFTGASGRELAP